MKKIANALQNNLELFITVGFVIALLYGVIYNSIVYGTYSSPW